jgi:hypothetical protein
VRVNKWIGERVADRSGGPASECMVEWASGCLGTWTD